MINHDFMIFLRFVIKYVGEIGVEMSAAISPKFFEMMIYPLLSPGIFFKILQHQNHKNQPNPGKDKHPRRSLQESNLLPTLVKQ